MPLIWIIFKEEKGLLAETAEGVRELSREMQELLLAFPSGIPGAMMIAKYGPAWAELAGTLGREAEMFLYATKHGVPGGEAYRTIYGYQHGGVVPDPVGKPVPIIAHGGETFLGEGKGLTFVVNLDGEKVGEIVSRQQGKAYAQRKEIG